jgi:phosphoglucomutase
MSLHPQDAPATRAKGAAEKAVTRGRRKDDCRRRITAKLTRAPGNNAAIDGLKIVTESGGSRPGRRPENIYKIYAESQSAAHLDALVSEPEPASP